MNILTTANFYYAIILLYSLAALLALLFHKRHRLGNIITHTICIMAALLGVVAGIMQINSGDTLIELAKFSLPIPFIVIDIVVDKLSSFFILGLSVIVLCVSIYSIGYLTSYYNKRNVGLFNFLYSSFILSMFFVITASNAIFFFIIWEIMSLISYFLVVFESEQKENQQAGTLYIVMTHIGASFLLIAFMIMFSFTNSFDIFTSSAAIPLWAKNMMFFCFLIGFGVKAGVIPFHIWLPAAHPAAPSNISALMSGFMIKTAIYGLIRFVFLYLNVTVIWWGILILLLGLVSTILGVAYALMEQDVKRLLAYSSIENIGIILMGLGVGFMAFARGNLIIGGLALTASLFHTFNHTLIKGGLFLGAGAIQHATGTKNLEKLGGLIKTMPITALFVLGSSLAISGLVPFNGFISKWLTFQSFFAGATMDNGSVNAIFIIGAVAGLALASALAAVCFVKLFGIAFLGRSRSEVAEEAKEVPFSMQAGMGILATSSLLLGIFPMVFLGLVDKVIQGIANGVNLADLKGGLFFAYYPIQVGENSIYPVFLLFILVVLVLLSMISIRVIGGKYRERKYGTWDCGFKELTPRMQYTATGFSKPLRIVFRILYRPRRELEIEEGPNPYFPLSLNYKIGTESVFEKYLYDPVLFFVGKFSIKARLRIQTGSIHMYLLYILIAIIAAMLYNLIV